MGTEYERRKDKYDNVLFRVQKGKAEDYRQAARDLGIGFWELIQSGVEEFIARHPGGEFQALAVKTAKDVPEQKLTTEQKRLVEEFNKLPVDTQKIVVKLLKAINSPSNQSD